MASIDREVLLVLYRSTGGAGWDNNTNWDTDAPLSEWCGVKINDKGRMVELVLPYNNLRGISDYPAVALLRRGCDLPQGLADPEVIFS